MEATVSPVSRTDTFATRAHNRYWWFRNSGATYEPPVFRLLSDAEWRIMEDWYEDTERRFTVPGECSIPAISALMGFIGGSNIGRIVQLGHYVGFSTLILGFLLRYMRRTHALISFDIDPNVTEYTLGWIQKAGLEEQVRLIVSDSSAPANLSLAREYLGDAPQIVFIDSSHAYEHTIKELDLWFEALAPGGMIFMHDVSLFAGSFDGTDSGGVARAVREWTARTGVKAMLLNNDLDVSVRHPLTYVDGCGLGILQKALQ